MASLLSSPASSFAISTKFTQLDSRVRTPSVSLLVRGGSRSGYGSLSGRTSLPLLKYQPARQSWRPILCEATASAPPADVQTHTHSILECISREDVKRVIDEEIKDKRLPKQAGPVMYHFLDSYCDAVVSSGREDAELLGVRIMSTVFDRIMLQFRKPFTFASHHKRMLEPYDYYAFAQNYVRPLINYSESYLGNLHLFDDMERQIQQGHNVVLLANHQTEADPAILALMLEHSHPYLAENMTYVAGDRVVLDPVCKPFSMGRNLLCVYSKKHINDVPELTDAKNAANRRTLREMASLFKAGGQFIWIAPSGGRDRPDPASDRYIPAKFDSSAVEMMRRLSDDSGPTGHLYPLALLSYPLMPPPRVVEKALGEQRVIGYGGVGLSAGPEIDFATIAGGISDRQQARDVFSEAVWRQVVEQYQVLEMAVDEKKGFAAGQIDGRQVSKLEQPWIQRRSKA